MRPPLPDVLIDLLGKPNPCVIGTVQPDGTPVTSAVWYLWDDGAVLTCMGASSPRVRNLRANPRVALTVLDEAGWYRQVTLLGEVTSLEPDPDLVVMDRISRQYLGTPYPARDQEHAAARIRITGWNQFGFDLD